MIITRSPMRVNLGGEGTDMMFYYSNHIGFVVSMAIDKYFYTMLTPRKDNKIQIISADFQMIETVNSLDELENSNLIIPKIVIKEFEIDTGFNLFMSSEIPVGTGLGSSGSAIVNLVKAMSLFTGVDMNKKEIAETACYLEIDVMGAPVGKQDQYIASYGGIQNLIFQKDGSVNTVPFKMKKEVKEELENSLMLFYTGISKNSNSILNEMKKGSYSVIENLHRVKDISMKVKEALSSGDTAHFGQLLNEQWECKKKLAPNVTNDKIDILYKLGIDSGALGGKLLGAGGGGFLMFYCDNEKSKAAIRKQMKNNGLSELDINIDESGVKTIINTKY